MLRIQYKKINSEFEYPFQTAHGLKTHQPALLIALTIGQVTGYGEAPPVHYYNVTVESMIEELVQKMPILVRYAFTEPERFWHFCHHLFPNNPFLVCALDMAYWNMFAQVKKQPLRDLLGLSDDLKLEQEPPTDYTIGMDSEEAMLEKMKAHPWPVYKVKVGGKNDLPILEAMRSASNARIRIDANGGWQLKEALEILPALKQLNIELIEQPLAKDAWDDMAILYAASDIPFIADESCVSESDVKQCLSCFHGINIKLTKCSGITPAVRMIKEARQAGKLVMMGCMSETEIGSLAIAQFLPWLHYVDMDGPLLLKNCVLKQLVYLPNGQVEIR